VALHGCHSNSDAVEGRNVRYPLALLGVVSLVTLGCDDRQQSQTRQLPPARVQPARQKAAVQSLIIRDDVSYSVFETRIAPGIKRALDVRLNKKVSESTLLAIALKLKAKDPRDYEWTYITYYLPPSGGSDWSWATTHFAPDLEVRILGLTTEEEAMLIAAPAPDNSEIIGRWLDEPPAGANRTTIFRTDDRIFIEQMFKTGGTLTNEVVESESSLARRFDKVEGSTAGDHWVVGPDGNLQVRDNDGLISSGKRID